MNVEVTVELRLSDVMSWNGAGPLPRVYVLHAELVPDGHGSFEVLSPEETISLLAKRTLDRWVLNADEILVGNPEQGWVFYKSRRWGKTRPDGRRRLVRL